MLATLYVLDKEIDHFGTLFQTSSLLGSYIPLQTFKPLREIDLDNVPINEAL